jgi:hypothetical protein
MSNNNAISKEKHLGKHHQLAQALAWAYQTSNH